MLLLPEIIITLAIFALLLLKLFGVEHKSELFGLLIAGVAFFLAISVLLVFCVFMPRTTLFSGFLLTKPVVLLQLLVCLFAVATLFLSLYAYYVFIMLSVLGMLLLIGAQNLLLIYLSLELIMLPTYVLAVMPESLLSAEAGIKYFVLGAASSAFLLLGFGLWYALTSSCTISTIAQFADLHSLIFLLGILFVSVAVIMKLGLVPLHFWQPDVFTATDTSATLFISSLPKVAGFILLVKMLASTNIVWLPQWQSILLVAAILSMFVGNFSALCQQNIKRMLGYAAIGQLGFAVLGIVAGNDYGIGATLFYIAIYCLMFIAVFGLLARQADSSKITGSPFFVSVFGLLMLAMIGIPPFAGFFAKLIILQALIAKNLVWVAVLATLFTVIAAYYYICVLVNINIETSVDTMERTRFSLMQNFFLAALVFILIIVGIFPQQMIQFFLRLFA